MFNKKIKKIITIEDMHCQGCVTRISNVLNNMKEVTMCEVSLENKEAKITLKKDVLDETLKKKISDLGFNVTNIKSL